MADFKHGTSSGYNYHKCRCDECRKWKSESSKKYYLNNTEAKREVSKAWYHANKERALEARRKYREEHYDEHKVYQAQYLKDNAESVNRKNRAWRKANPRKAWAYNWINRHQTRGGGITPEVADWIKSLPDDTKCTYCGEKFSTIDHIVPIAKGGTNDRDNLTPACNTCNRRKQHMTMEEFIIRLRDEPN